MRQLTVWLLAAGLVACSTQERDNMDTGSAAGLGDDHVARHVTGVYLLSTDYHYQEPCNYLPEEFVRNLFQLGEKVELEKYSDINRCELRWGSNKIGFYLESDKPFESVYQSEYHFNKLFEPSANKAADQQAPKPTIFGPAPEGTNNQFATASTTSQQDSTRGADPSGPIEGMTKPTPPLTAPAHNTPTGQAVKGVGDKAIWEPGKKSLHVLFNNHVFSVFAQMPGDSATIKQGSIGLAKLVIYSLNDNRDPRD